jgi:hypothetical protein
MRKSLVLALMAVGSGASYAAAVTSVGDELHNPDPSTWRWSVSSILDRQKGSPADTFQAAEVADPVVFQRHERYSPLGVPEPGKRFP